MAPDVPAVYSLDYQPCGDPSWARNPGACTDMDGFAQLARGCLGTCGSTAGVGGGANFAVTGTDALRAQLFRQTDGTVRFLQFRVQNIDEYTNAGVRTNRGTGYNAATTDWSAAAWGNQIIACNKLDGTQSSTGAGFANLVGAPKAKFVAANVNFVMLANVDDGAGYGNTDAVWWCAERNPANWTPSLATQAGRYRLLDVPGPITGFVAYQDRFVAFKDNAIFVGEYVGPSRFLFSWRVVSSRIGCVAPRSIVEVDGRLFFLHSSGLWSFDGQNLTSVGPNVFQKLFSLASAPGAVYAAGDDYEGIAWFIAHDRFNGGGGQTRWLAYAYGYNVRSRRWSQLKLVATTTLAVGQVPNPLVIGSTADLTTFTAGAVGYQGAFALLDNGPIGFSAVVYPAATASNVGTVTTGLVGATGAAETIISAYPRFLTSVLTGLASSPNPLGTSTLNGHSAEHKAAEASVTVNANSELTRLDGRVRARFHSLTLNTAPGSFAYLAGVGFSPPGDRR